MADIVIRGGDVYDPDLPGIGRRDVFIRDGRFAAPFESSATGSVIDAQGLLVTPGWVDLHTHVFVGQDLGVDPNRLAPATGVTTVIDTGSAGAHLYEAFLAAVAGAVPRVRAFLNISTIGTTSILLAGELRQLDYLDEAACLEALRRHPEIIGVKVRASANVGGDNTIEALLRARRVADAAGRPLMVHIGPAPVTYPDVLSLLRAGDIVTHCFTGHSDFPLVDPAGGADVLESALAARERGVLFDVGHGGGSFDAARAAAAIRAGFLPDTISSDVHAYADQPEGGDLPAAGLPASAADSLVAGGLPLVVDKFLALGMSLEQVLSRVTASPAAAAGLTSLGAGSLRLGAPADLAVYRLVEGPLTLRDPQGFTFHGERSIRPVLTVQSGTVVFDRRTAPAGADVLTEG